MITTYKLFFTKTNLLARKVTFQPIITVPFPGQGCRELYLITEAICMLLEQVQLAHNSTNYYYDHQHQTSFGS